MKRYLFLFALILIVGLDSNAQALLFTFSGSDLGGTGTATMDISIDGYTLTALIENTSPTTLDDDVLEVNSPGITAFGFDFVDLDMFVLDWWELTAYSNDGSLVNIGGTDGSTGDWELTEDGNTSGIKLDYVPNTEQAVQGALYNPEITEGEGALPNFYTEAIFTMKFIDPPTSVVASTVDDNPTLLISEDSVIVRMQNVGLDGEGSLKLPGKVPEPSTMLLLGFGLIGIAVVGRKKSQTS